MLYKYVFELIICITSTSYVNRERGEVDMYKILKRIADIGIIPVIKIDNTQHALPLAKALIKGGIPIAEVTLRTPQAEEAIRLIAQNIPEMLVGAGTVLTTSQVDSAIAAGAKFIVSPGFNPKVVEYCIQKGILIVPGCVTPSDIEKAIEHNLEVVKFFPAEASGGIKMIKALVGPYTNIKFIPTGGINESNIGEYLSYNKVLACGGSWMVEEGLVRNQSFDEIEQKSHNAILKVLDFKIAHIGIRCDLDKNTTSQVDALNELFGFNKHVMPGAIQLSESQNTYLAISTSSMARALRYLSDKNIAVDESTRMYDVQGNLVSIQLLDSINGVSIQLIQEQAE